MSVIKNLKRVTVPSILKMKAQGEKIAMLTAYDALMAQVLDESGIDIIPYLTYQDIIFIKMIFLIFSLPC